MQPCVEQPLPVSPVVVHDLVVQILLVGKIPVGCQVLLVHLLMEVTQLGCGGHEESVGDAVRGHWVGGPGLHSQSQAQLSPYPGKGHCLCRLSPALTLQQVGDEQRCALVTAGQPPQCQVLLDLEGEEVPAEGNRSLPWWRWAQQRAGCQAEA